MTLGLALDRQEIRSEKYVRSSAYATLISNISERARAKRRGVIRRHLQGLHQRDEQVRRKVWENPRRREDSGSEMVDAREFAELPVKWHHIAIRRIVIALENIIDKVTTHSAGEEAFEEGYGKTIELAVQAVFREQEPKVDGMEEWVPTVVYRDTSTAVRVKKERIVLEERSSGPRPEARKEEKEKRKVAKVTPEFAGAVGKQDTLRQFAPRGVGTRV